MPKRGQHHNDHRDSDVSRGHNRHEKSTHITTGGYKKPETYEKQKYEGKPTNTRAQDAKNEWHQDTHHRPEREDLIGKRRSGSDSNADSGTRGY